MIIYLTKEVRHRFHYELVDAPLPGNHLFEEWYADSFSIDMSLNINFFAFMHTRSWLCVFDLIDSGSHPNISRQLTHALNLYCTSQHYPQVDWNELLAPQQLTRYARASNPTLTKLLTNRICSFILLTRAELYRKDSFNIESIAERVNKKPHPMISDHSPKSLFLQQINQMQLTRSTKLH